MKNVNIISKKSKRNLLKEIDKNGFADIRGELEVTASKDGKVFHKDVGENVVTIYAKHSTMHLLTGEAFTTHGEQRLFDSEDAEAHTATGPGEGTNFDGTLLSGQQYFSTNADPNFNLESRWSKSTINPDSASDGDASSQPEEVKYPFFPTKMLFGTGFEWNAWGDIPEDYQGAYADDEWGQSLFETNIDLENNNYSGLFSAETLIRTRTMNDIFAGALTTPTITDEDFAVPGAIKDGLYSSSEQYRGVEGSNPTIEAKTFEDGGNEFLLRPWRGIGRPSFLYARRENRFFQPASEVALSSEESNLENQITFTVVMPEQTGEQSGIFYPYNGYTLKVAGLFCDARLLIGNEVPTTGAELELYNRMSYGIMYAKRYISPIQKSHDVSISSRWTLYL